MVPVVVPHSVRNVLVVIPVEWLDELTDVHFGSECNYCRIGLNQLLVGHDYFWPHGDHLFRLEEASERRQNEESGDGHDECKSTNQLGSKVPSNFPPPGSKGNFELRQSEKNEEKK